MNADSSGTSSNIEPAIESTFTVEVRERGRQVLLDVEGEIDGYSIKALHRVARDALDGYDGLILRLHDVTFIDSAGLRALIILKRLCEREIKSLVLEQPSRVVVRLLQLTALDSHFTVTDIASIAD